MLELVKAVDEEYYKGKKETRYIVAVEDDERCLYKKVYTDKEAFEKKCKFIKDILVNYMEKKCSQEEVMDLLLEQ